MTGRFSARSFRCVIFWRDLVFCFDRHACRSARHRQSHPGSCALHAGTCFWEDADHSAALLIAGVNHTTVMLVAVFMAQMGEFSFVLAGAGREEGVVDENQFGVILATAVASILLTPMVVKLAPALGEKQPGCRALPLMSWQLLVRNQLAKSFAGTPSSAVMVAWVRFWEMRSIGADSPIP